MSINKLFAVLDCQPTTPNRLRGEARNGRRAIYVDRSRRPDGDLRDKPGCVPASGCTKGAPWRATRCIGADGSPVGGAQQRRPSPYLVSQEEKPSKSARGAGPPGTRKARREQHFQQIQQPFSPGGERAPPRAPPPRRPRPYALRQTQAGSCLMMQYPVFEPRRPPTTRSLHPSCMLNALKPITYKQTGALIPAIAAL